MADFCGSEPSVGNWPVTRAKLRPIPLTQVKVAGFLGERIDRNNRESILAGRESVLLVRYEAMARGEPDPGADKLAPDTDAFKWLEAVAYAARYQDDSADLQGLLEQFVSLIQAHQQPDGFLNTQVPGRMTRLDRVTWHDLYWAGHFFEAAIAHKDLTGKTHMLDGACRWANYLISECANKNTYFDGIGEREHPEIELALVRLYRSTGDRRYLDFAVTIAEKYHVVPNVADLRCGVGDLHAVRVGYLLTAYAELYLETGEERFVSPLKRIWDEMVTTRLYITGGVGGGECKEIIPLLPHLLPQEGSIAETCASIAMIFFSWRMHAISGESRYFDVIETIVYNHFLGALSLDQLGIAYYNGLRALDPRQTRSHRVRLPEVHDCSCCFPNAWRFLAQLPEYIFSRDGDGVFVNLYTTATAECGLESGARFKLHMQTDYPHDGKVMVRVESDQPVRFALRLRVPQWCSGASVRVGGSESADSLQPGTYCSVDREWHSGDTVELNLPMQPVVLTSTAKIAANLGQVAFRRGPIVYCFEADDTAELDLARVAVHLPADNPQGAVREEWRQELLGGVHVLYVPAGRLPPGPKDDRLLYAELPASDRPVPKGEIMLIPFYARGNRSESGGWTTFVPLIQGGD